MNCERVQSAEYTLAELFDHSTVALNFTVFTPLLTLQSILKGKNLQL